ncbi:hypothetical protein BU23DRAFT_473915, partial [Bimuria novae-zelandiae CBS 107.79]
MKIVQHEEAKSATASVKYGGIKDTTISFKDALGREFSFPHHLINTWSAMESVIKQAFRHSDSLQQHVLDGHYELIDETRRIILPLMWDTTIQP